MTTTRKILSSALLAVLLLTGSVAMAAPSDAAVVGTDLWERCDAEHEAAVEACFQFITTSDDDRDTDHRACQLALASPECGGPVPAADADTCGVSL